MYNKDSKNQENIISIDENQYNDEDEYFQSQIKETIKRSLFKDSNLEQKYDGYFSEIIEQQELRISNLCQDIKDKDFQINKLKKGKQNQEYLYKIYIRELKQNYENKLVEQQNYQKDYPRQNIDQFKQEINDLKTLNSQYLKQNNLLKQQIKEAEYQSSIQLYDLELSIENQYQQKTDKLKQQLLKYEDIVKQLNQKYQMVKSQLKEKQYEIEAYKLQVEQIPQQHQQWQRMQGSCQPEQQQLQKIKYYKTRTGQKYHKYGCQYINDCNIDNSFYWNQIPPGLQKCKRCLGQN